MEGDRALADTSGVGPEGQQWESLGRSPPAAESDLAELLGVLRAVRAGDFSVRMSAASPGLLGKIADRTLQIERGEIITKSMEA